MSNINVVNPGLVNVANQADGLVSVDQTKTVSPSSNSGPTKTGITYADGPVSVDQTKTVSPSSNPGPTAKGIAYADGKVSVDQPVTVTPPMTAGRTVKAGAASPLRPNVLNTTQNTVVGQVYGTGTPQNVFV